MEIIERKIYLDHIVSLLGRGMILILVGQRRVGKSCLLRQLEQYLSASEQEANVVYINKELHTFRSITTADELYDYVSPRLPEGGNNFLLIDEVQDIADYHTALRSLHAEGRCQIVATGSNAYLFSSELSTRLSGRYIEIPVYSLTYSEFLIFHGRKDSDDALETYLRVGGLPGLCHYDIDSEQQVRDYLQSVYNTVMMRDVVARESIRNVRFIENLAAFVADNIGKFISIRNIAGVMKSQGEKVSDVLTATYLRHLCGALIVQPIARYDIHGKRLFEQMSKYYFSDHGLRNLLCGFELRGSIEKVLENVVWLHLVAHGFKVMVGTLRRGEVDFVATRGDARMYVQVAYRLSGNEVIAREFGNLRDIGDDYPKMVVTMEPVGGNLPEYPGIRHLRLREFLNTIR